MSRKFSLRWAALVSLSAIAFGSVALNAETDPEHDRLEFVELYQKKFLIACLATMCMAHSC